MILFTSHLSFLVLIFHVQSTDAQNITSTIAPMIAPSASVAPSSSISMMPTTSGDTTGPTALPEITPSSSTTDKFETRLEIQMIVKVKINCSDMSLVNTTKDKLEELYKDDAYDLKLVKVSTFTKEEKCHVNITLVFGKKLNSTRIEEVLREEFKDNDLNGIELEENSLVVKIYVAGVILGKWGKPSKSECDKTCCGGAGGPMEEKRTCSPLIKCVNYEITRKKTYTDCKTVCKCAGASIRFSVSMLLVCAVINWIFK